MNLFQANKLLQDNKCTCIILQNDKIIYKSSYKGVKPLLLFLNKSTYLENNDKLILIDKIIGRAAILLAAKCKIKKIFTPVISAEALEIARLYNIEYEASATVSYILNNAKNGKCPIESSVSGIVDPDTALINIKNTIAELAKKANS